MSMKYFTGFSILISQSQVKHMEIIIMVDDYIQLISFPEENYLSLSLGGIKIDDTAA